MSSKIRKTSVDELKLILLKQLFRSFDSYLTGGCGAMSHAMSRLFHKTGASQKEMAAAHWAYLQSKKGKTKLQILNMLGVTRALAKRMGLKKSCLLV